VDVAAYIDKPRPPDPRSKAALIAVETGRLPVARGSDAAM
jgi:hypothetical protein